jgi:hypothetical protein
MKAMIKTAMLAATALTLLIQPLKAEGANWFMARFRTEVCLPVEDVFRFYFPQTGGGVHTPDEVRRFLTNNGALVGKMTTTKGPTGHAMINFQWWASPEDEPSNLVMFDDQSVCQTITAAAKTN